MSASIARSCSSGSSTRAVPSLAYSAASAFGIAPALARRVEHPLRLPEAAQRREAREARAPGPPRGRGRAGRRGRTGARRGRGARASPRAPSRAGAWRGRPRAGPSRSRPPGRAPRRARGQSSRSARRSTIERSASGCAGSAAQELPVELLRAGDVPELRVGEVRRLREERRSRLADDPRAPLVERDEVLPAGRGLVQSTRAPRTRAGRRAPPRGSRGGTGSARPGWVRSSGVARGGGLPGRKRDAPGV